MFILQHYKYSYLSFVFLCASIAYFNEHASLEKMIKYQEKCGESPWLMSPELNTDNSFVVVFSHTIL